MRRAFFRDTDWDKDIFIPSPEVDVAAIVEEEGKIQTLMDSDPKMKELKESAATMEPGQLADKYLELYKGYRAEVRERWNEIPTTPLELPPVRPLTLGEVVTALSMPWAEAPET